MKKLFTIFAATLCSLTMSAHLEFGALYSGEDYNDPTTTIQKDGDVAWITGDASGEGVRLGGSNTGIAPGSPAWNWDDKYVILALPANGQPEKINFIHRTNNNNASSAEWYVAESADGEQWSNAWTTNSKSSSAQSREVALQSTTRFVKLCYSGNFAGYFFSVVVSGGYPTAIEQSREAQTGRKVLVDGKIRILRGNKAYDLNGRSIR